MPGYTVIAGRLLDQPGDLPGFSRERWDHEKGPVNYSAVLQVMGHRLGVYLCRDYVCKHFVAVKGNMCKDLTWLARTYEFVILVRMILKIYCL